MTTPIPNSYSPHNAAKLVAFSAAAYQTAPPRDSLVIDQNGTNMRVVLSNIGSDLVVAFRGTQSLANFVTDAQVRRVPLFPGSDAEAHEGFFFAFESVRTRLEEAVAELRSERVWFTGHSLGGALATLAGLYFAGPGVSVYTFGAPRVGNAAFRRLYQSQLGAHTFRIVHADDIVPHIPWLLGRYRHVGHEVLYGGNALTLTLSRWEREQQRSLSNMRRVVRPAAELTRSVQPLSLLPGGERQDEGGRFIIDRSKWLYALDDLVVMLQAWRKPLSAGEWLADHHVNNYLALFSSPNPAPAPNRLLPVSA